jgi:superkiller protein 3
MSTPQLIKFFLIVSTTVVSPAIAIQPHQLMLQQDPEISLKIYASAQLEVNCTSAVACAQRGSELRSRGQLQEAIAAYQRAIKLNPNIGDAIYNNLGVTLYELGTVFRDQGRMEEAHEQFDLAEEIYRRSIELHPTVSKYVNLSVLLRDLNRREEALNLLQSAISLDPNYAAAHYASGIVLQELGRLTEATNAYRRAHELDPRYPFNP